MQPWLYRGRWALVTGASAGIGRGFAEKLAERREGHLQRGRLYRIMFAIAGAIVVAVFAVGAAGGMGAVAAHAGPERLAFIPSGGSALTYVLSFLLIQWWAWKNTDGGGMLVQRMAACRDERDRVERESHSAIARCVRRRMERLVDPRPVGLEADPADE